MGYRYSKGKYHHPEKYGNDDQGRVRVGGFVYPTGFLSFEVEGVDGSDTFNH